MQILSTLSAGDKLVLSALFFTIGIGLALWLMIKR
ncbi:hypothetical protein UFOVP549_11 [uncultured Caudovirales phage]|uniref:Uncharacterized protein n=1 Tax=uncultured Caudovirales phage TaxID=2100421 RepID=A0A6J5MVI6_9CAUD|nr:hypothetical protein UFOVP549_11 [uncultured Caudovirales phage]